MRGSTISSSSRRSNLPRGNTEARRTSSRAPGESWSIREAITACTVGGSGRPDGPTVVGGSSRSSRSNIPVISTMNRGFPPA